MVTLQHYTDVMQASRTLFKRLQRICPAGAIFIRSISKQRRQIRIVHLRGPVLLLLRSVTVAAPCRSELFTWFRELRDFLPLRMSDLAVPEDIADYLSGIGDVSDFAGVPWTLRLGVTLDTTLVNGLSGHYGKWMLLPTFTTRPFLLRSSL